MLRATFSIGGKGEMNVAQYWTPKLFHEDKDSCGMCLQQFIVSMITDAHNNMYFALCIRILFRYSSLYQRVSIWLFCIVHLNIVSIFRPLSKSLNLAFLYCVLNIVSIFRPLSKSFNLAFCIVYLNTVSIFRPLSKSLNLAFLYCVFEYCFDIPAFIKESQFGFFGLGITLLFKNSCHYQRV